MAASTASLFCIQAVIATRGRYAGCRHACTFGSGHGSAQTCLYTSSQMSAHTSMHNVGLQADRRARARMGAWVRTRVPACVEACVCIPTQRAESIDYQIRPASRLHVYEHECVRVRVRLHACRPDGRISVMPLAVSPVRSSGSAFRHAVRHAFRHAVRHAFRHAFDMCSTCI